MFSEHGVWCHSSFSVPVEALLIEHGTLSCCRLRFSLLAAFHVVPSNQSCMFLSLSPLLFTFLSSATCKASSDNHFAFLLFFFFEGWGVILFTISCTMLRTTVHNSSGTALTKSSPLNLFVTSTTKSYKILFKSYLTGLVFFPVFFSLRLNFAMRLWWSEPQSAPCLVFADCIQLLHLQLQKM